MTNQYDNLDFVAYFTALAAMSPQEIEQNILPPTAENHLARWKAGESVTDIAGTKEKVVDFIANRVAPIGGVSAIGIMATPTIPPLGILCGITSAVSMGAAVCAEPIGDFVANARENIARYRILHDPKKTLNASTANKL